MLNWWISLTLAGQIFACMAVFATVILVIQIILLLVGFGSSSDTEVDTDTDGDVETEGIFGEDMPEEGDAFDGEPLDVGLRLITVRGIIAFLAVMGWTGVILTRMNVPIILTVAISAGCGFMAMLLIAVLFNAIMKLQSNGNINLKNAVGLSGETYLAVPPQRTGKGKVSITVQGRYSEYDAMTDEEEKIPTGASVVVTGITAGILLVKTKNKL